MNHISYVQRVRFAEVDRAVEHIAITSFTLIGCILISEVVYSRTVVVDRMNANQVLRNNVGNNSSNHVDCSNLCTHDITRLSSSFALKQDSIFTCIDAVSKVGTLICGHFTTEHLFIAGILLKQSYLAICRISLRG